MKCTGKCTSVNVADNVVRNILAYCRMTYTAFRTINYYCSCQIITTFHHSMLNKKYRAGCSFVRSRFQITILAKKVCTCTTLCIICSIAMLHRINITDN